MQISAGLLSFNQRLYVPHDAKLVVETSKHKLLRRHSQKVNSLSKISGTNKQVTAWDGFGTQSKRGLANSVRHHSDSVSDKPKVTHGIIANCLGRANGVINASK